VVGAKIVSEMSAPTTTLSLRKHKTRLSTQEAQELDDATPSYVNSHHTRTQDARRKHAARTQDAGRRTQDAGRTRRTHAGRRTRLYKQTLCEVVVCVRLAPAAATGFRPRRSLPCVWQCNFTSDKFAVLKIHTITISITKIVP
jgi:hypothetical protein